MSTLKHINATHQNLAHTKVAQHPEPRMEVHQPSTFALGACNPMFTWKHIKAAQIHRTCISDQHYSQRGPTEEVPTLPHCTLVRNLPQPGTSASDNCSLGGHPDEVHPHNSTQPATDKERGTQNPEQHRKYPPQKVLNSVVVVGIVRAKPTQPC